jgi:hypothetical protein
MLVSVHQHINITHETMSTITHEIPQLAIDVTIELAPTADFEEVAARLNYHIRCFCALNQGRANFRFAEIQAIALTQYCIRRVYGGWVGSETLPLVVTPGIIRIWLHKSDRILVFPQRD